MRNLFVLVVFLISFQSYSQSEQEICILLKKATSEFCQMKYTSCAKTLNKFYKLNPDHFLSHEAVYAEGMCYYKAGNNKKAKVVLKKVMLFDNYNESDSSGYSVLLCDYLQQNCNNILVPDYLVNIQHEASILLFEISMKVKEYDEAYFHLDNARRYYRFWHGCGTNDMSESIRLSMLFSDYYDKTGKPDTAISELLTHLFEPAALPVMYYSELVNMTYAKMKKHFGDQKLQTELLTSVSNIYSEPYTDGHGHEAKHWYIKFFGQRIRIAPDYLFSKTDNIEEVQNYLRQTLFYSLVYKLPVE